MNLLPVVVLPYTLQQNIPRRATIQLGTLFIPLLGAGQGLAPVRLDTAMPP